MGHNERSPASEPLVSASRLKSFRMRTTRTLAGVFSSATFMHLSRIVKSLFTLWILVVCGFVSSIIAVAGLVMGAARCPLPGQKAMIAEQIANLPNGVRVDRSNWATSVSLNL
jgi:hypothetical protein